MAWTLDPYYIGQNLLASCFQQSGWSSGYVPNRVIAYAGTMPPSPNVTTGITALNSIKTISAQWNAASDGVATLASSISITPNASGTLSFLRFFYNNTSVPLFDVSCSLSPSNNSAVASTLSVVSGNQFSITDLRLKLNTSGDISVSPSIANDFISKMTNGGSFPYGYGLYAGTNLDANTGLYNRVVSIKLYSGSIPTRADTAPTSGTELWSTNLSGTADLFMSSGLGLLLASALTANAIASGTPTYCRIRKGSYASGGATFPETIIQVPVATTGSGCTLSASTFTSGQSYSITGLTLTL